MDAVNRCDGCGKTFDTIQFMGKCPACRVNEMKETVMSRKVYLVEIGDDSSIAVWGASILTPEPGPEYRKGIAISRRDWPQALSIGQKALASVPDDYEIISNPEWNSFSDYVLIKTRYVRPVPLKGLEWLEKEPIGTRRSIRGCRFVIGVDGIHWVDLTGSVWRWDGTATCQKDVGWKGKKWVIDACPETCPEWKPEEEN